MAIFGLFHRSKEGVETPLEVDNIMDITPASAAALEHGTTLRAQEVHPDVKAALDEAAKLRDELAAERTARASEAQAREAADRKAKADGIHAAATSFGEKFGAKLTPAARTSAARLHAFAGLSAAGLPAVDSEGRPLDARADLDAFCAALPDHGLGAGSVVASGVKGLTPLANGSQPADDDARARAANDAFFARMGATRDPAPTF